MEQFFLLPDKCHLDGQDIKMTLNALTETLAETKTGSILFCCDNDSILTVI